VSASAVALLKLLGVSASAVALLIMLESVSPDVGFTLLHASKNVVAVCTWVQLRDQTSQHPALARTHARTHARARADTHTHTHTQATFCKKVFRRCRSSASSTCCAFSKLTHICMHNVFCMYYV